MLSVGDASLVTYNFKDKVWEPLVDSMESRYGSTGYAVGGVLLNSNAE